MSHHRRQNREGQRGLVISASGDTTQAQESGSGVPGVLGPDLQRPQCLAQNRLLQVSFRAK